MVASLPLMATPRLFLRAAARVDLPLLIELNSDAEVMRFQLGRAATAAETEDEWEAANALTGEPDASESAS